MSPNCRPYVADNDELLLASHLLGALECGDMEMHAADFRWIAITSREAMAALTTKEVVRVRDGGPRSLRALAENTLHQRGIIDWMSNRDAHLDGLAVWRALRHRMTTGAA